MTKSGKYLLEYLFASSKINCSRPQQAQKNKLTTNSTYDLVNFYLKKSKL